MAVQPNSANFRAFEKVSDESDESDEEADAIDPNDIGTVSLGEIRRRLSR